MNSALASVVAAAVVALAAAPALAATDPCAGLPAAEKAQCKAREAAKDKQADAPTKRKVDDDAPDAPTDDDPGGADLGMGTGCLDVPMALYNCELCSAQCKLGGVIGGVSGGILGFAGGLGVGWLLLTADTDPLETRLSETATAGLFGAIAVGAVGLVIGAGVGSVFGLFAAVDEAKPAPKRKRAPARKQKRR